MATVAPEFVPSPATTEQRFIAKLIVAMALTVLAGFSTQFLAGRSTFGAPWPVHVHAVVFMGWVALFVAQGWLATRGPLELHRKLGWVAAAYIVLMLAAAINVVTVAVRAGHAPFFFRPQQFLIANPGTILFFAGLTAAAISQRRRTDWHARLHVCAMAAIIGPAFGRLLPMPLLVPHAFEIAVSCGLLFPLAGMIRDFRHSGEVHPAWWCGTAALIAMLPILNLVAYSPVGGAIYRAVTDGHPGSSVPALEFAPPPAGPLITGR